jgi:hypothetical protein
VVVVDDEVVVVDGGVDVADGGCEGVNGADDGLVGVSSWVAVCVLTLTVVVDVVCMLESMVTLAVGTICTFASIPSTRHSSHLSGPWLISQLSRSAILPCSSPSFLPCSNAVFRAFSSSSLARCLASS